MIRQGLQFCAVLFVFLAGFAYGGTYQRAKDGKTLVWNNYPGTGDVADWSGSRDGKGYATGYGTLTWSTVAPTIETGSNIPSSRRRTSLVGRYSGKMVRGKLEGAVTIVDDKGKSSRATYAAGKKVADSDGATAANSKTEPTSEGPVVEPPPLAEGPKSTPVELPPMHVSGETPKKEPAPEPPVASPKPSVTIVAMAKASPPANIPAPPPPAESSPTPLTIESSAKDSIMANYKEQAQSVLALVGEATDNFHEVNQINSVKPLPAAISQSVGALVHRTRDLRSELGTDAAPEEWRTENQTADALLAVDQITRNIARGNAPQASAKVADFLKNNPEPATDGQKPLWRYLNSLQSSCGRLEKAAADHLQRAESFISEGKSSDAIREYQEANRIFPNPVLSEKIRRLQDNGLGL